MVVDYDIVCNVKEFYSMGIPHFKRGVYLFYDNKDKLIYIGSTTYLRERIMSHLRGEQHLTKFFKEITTIKILLSKSFDTFRENNIDCHDIEYYLINELNPKYNQKMSKKTAYKCNQLKE